MLICTRLRTLCSATTFLTLVCAVLLTAPASAVTIPWAFVGDPGNAADNTGFGAVGSSYRIAQTEVTVSQYVEFLNSVAQTDTNGLYNAQMSDFFGGGIFQFGAPGAHTYAAVIPGRENTPIPLVSFYDALRFTNWLHNGQPAGPQGAATTEDGAYTINLAAPNSIVRNPGAQVFLPSEDEWYKAAYYNPGSTSYFDYPTSSDTATTCAPPGPVPNTANCGNVNGVPVPVGAYSASSSPYGTSDQAGNLWEWNEALIFGSRGIRGGSYASPPILLSAGIQNSQGPTFENFVTGFRVASVPEPGTGTLLFGGLVALAARRRSQKHG